ncbi:low molecular weight phosphotyrosine protein phosphatase [Capsaspora owczarzaki ATCC 30864]|uniref:Low molecular weight phosphotyrosine protein phosphatase n=1 Tax=Capsaspora owczarzaki (strain ATCC 30864) TaxID=595528 RepID=A0A0D2X2M1_CAPO3|nr:low molecular weight phosphotyrosine protein phosphatase [Capsaspora owczarzaki ATCC 30864]
MLRLGNICRSPMAEAVLAHLVAEAGLTETWRVDSAGTANYHVGDAPDHRTVQVCRSRNVAIKHTGRQLCKEDFELFDWILVMDDSNLSNTMNVKSRHYGQKKTRATVELLGNYDPTGKRLVDDPYYGGISDFEDVFAQCERSLRRFLEAHKAS